MRVESERTRYAAAERPPQYEVERGEARQFIAHDVAEHDVAQKRLHALGGQHLPQKIVMPRVMTNDGYVQRIALIARA